MKRKSKSAAGTGLMLAMLSLAAAAPLSGGAIAQEKARAVDAALMGASELPR